MSIVIANTHPSINISCRAAQLFFVEKRGVSFTCIVSLDLDQIKEMKPPWQSNGVSIVYCSKYDTFIDIDDKSIKDT